MGLRRLVRRVVCERIQTEAIRLTASARRPTRAIDWWERINCAWMPFPWRSIEAPFAVADFRKPSSSLSRLTLEPLWRGAYLLFELGQLSVEDADPLVDVRRQFAARVIGADRRFGICHLRMDVGRFRFDQRRHVVDVAGSDRHAIGFAAIKAGDLNARLRGNRAHQLKTPDEAVVDIGRALAPLELRTRRNSRGTREGRQQACRVTDGQGDSLIDITRRLAPLELAIGLQDRANNICRCLRVVAGW